MNSLNSLKVHNLACLWMNAFNSYLYLLVQIRTQVSHTIGKLFVWKFSTVVWIESSKKIKYSPVVFIHSVHHTFLEVVKNLFRRDQTANLRLTTSSLLDQARDSWLNDEIFVVLENSTATSLGNIGACSITYKVISQLNWSYARTILSHLSVSNARRPKLKHTGALKIA